MTRNNADFKEQILLHRGLRVASPSEVNTSQLGEHWTTDEKVARVFAGKSGVVVSASVPKSGTLEGEWETRKREWMSHPEYFDSEDNYSGEDPEKEVRVHPDTKVSILGIKKVKQ